jgi:hypothetical protein
MTDKYNVDLDSAFLDGYKPRPLVPWRLIWIVIALLLMALSVRVSLPGPGLSQCPSTSTLT